MYKQGLKGQRPAVRRRGGRDGKRMRIRGFKGGTRLGAGCRAKGEGFWASREKSAASLSSKFRASLAESGYYGGCEGIDPFRSCSGNGAVQPPGDGCDGRRREPFAGFYAEQS